MTWLAPWAFVGLAAMALPIVVHWLARHQADRRVFPTVRFLPTTPPTSVRRHQLTDVALLAVRCAIVAAAAAALAQPALTTPPAPGGQPPRAVVVDTSASLLRTLADGRTGATAAEAAVATALADADLSVVIREPDVRHGLALAGAWLRKQPGAGEVVVVSDFQVGAMAEPDLDVLPASAGRRLVRVYGAAAAEAAARAVVGDEKISSEVIFSTAAGAPAIVVAFVGAPEFAELQASARPLDTPAAYALAARVADAGAEKPSGGFFLVSNEKKPPDGFSAPVPASDALLVLSTAPPDSIDAASLVARAMRAAAAPTVPLAEREPDTIDASAIDAWQRDPRPDDAPRGGEPYPLSPWMWVFVLALLGLETWVRRQRRSSLAKHDTQEVPDARVA